MTQHLPKTRREQEDGGGSSNEGNARGGAPVLEPFLFFLFSYIQSMKQTGSERGRRLQLVCVRNDLPAQKQARVEESRAGSSGQQGLIQPAVQICSVNPVGSIPQPY